MKTEEKLLLRIFDTKNRILQQIKQQTELYNRHLASKSLADGVTPPSWLWNNTSSISQELSKEELISELLPPGPPSRPPVRYSVAGSSQYSKPFITAHRGVADGSGVEDYALDKDGHDAAEGKNAIVEGDECIAQNTSNYLPELAVSSPADIVDVRISNIYTAPDQSLARIQRSKSRQRAIEQRDSAKSKANRSSGIERTPRASFSGNELFTLDYEQVDHINDSNIQSEPCAASSGKQSAYHLRNESNIDPCSNEIKLTGLEPEGIHSLNERPKSTETSFISTESCRVKRKSEIDNENSEGCAVKGKIQTDNDNSGDGYNFHAGPDATSKSSGSSRSLEKPTLRNSEIENKDSIIFKKYSITSRYVNKIDSDIGSSIEACRSNEKGTIFHPESSTRSKSSGKSCEETASKKEESGMEEKRSDVYVGKSSTPKTPADPESSTTSKSSGKSCEETASKKEESGMEEKISNVYVKKSSTPKTPAEHENHLSDFAEETYFSECLPGKGVEKYSITPQDNSKIDGDIGSSIEAGRSNEKCAIFHPESSTRSKSSGKNCEETALEKEESRMEEKRSDVYVEKSSTPKIHADPESSTRSKSSGKSCEDTALKKEESGVEEKRSDVHVGKSSTPKTLADPESSTRSKSSGKSCEETASKKEESGMEEKRSDVYVGKSSTPKTPADPESSTRSKSSGRSCEEASKKEESGMEERRSDVYVEKSSTPKTPAEHANHLSDFAKENYFSECVPGKCVEKHSITPRDITKTDGDIGSSIEAGRSNEKCAIFHPESSTRSKSSGKSCEETATKKEESGMEEKRSDVYVEKSSTPKTLADPRSSTRSESSGKICEETASKKEESGMEEKRSDVYVEKSSTPKTPAEHENHLSNFAEENYFSECVPGKGVDNIASSNDPESSNHQICSFVGFLEQAYFENGSGNWILPPNAGQEVSDIREIDLEDGQPQNDNDLNSNIFQRASGDHLMLPCSDMCDKAEQLESANKTEAVEPGTVELAEAIHVFEEDEYREKSLGNSCSPFPDAAAGVPRDSFTTNKAGDSGVQTTKSEPRRSCHCELEARQNNAEHSPSNKAASTQSNPSNAIEDVNVSDERCEFSSELLAEEEKCNSTNYENIVNNSQKNSEASARSSWTEEAVESSLDGLFPSTNPSFLSSVYSSKHEDEQRSEIKSDDFPLGIAKLSSCEGISSEGRLSVQVVGHQPQHSDHSLSNRDLKRKIVVTEDDIPSHSIQSPHIKGLCEMDVDHMQPVLESFIQDSQSENDAMGFPRDVINFDNLELSRSPIARASMLEILCKSVSASTPSHLSSTFKTDKVPDLFHSVPNGLLEHTDLRGVFFGDDVEEFQVSRITSSEAEGGLEGVSCTNNFPRGASMGVSSVNGFSSPEGRYWEGYSSRSSSSGKRSSSNREFECYTIKEDSSTSEGNESVDEDCDKLSKDAGSSALNCHAIDSDKFLEDGDSLTVPCAAIDSDAIDIDKFLEDGDSLTVPCAAREPSTGTNNKFKTFLRSSQKNRKDTQTPLSVVNGKRIAKESLHNRFKKVKTSGNSSLKNERTREPYGSNIVSNMTSFVPLVQQKQAAAKACPGKRDIKVKALEAAEAAKRMEEKRENERKLKKEALKTERARMMEQKAKQSELLKKKKEDEQRKKDADILLRKRLREEEERKEERKRTKTEDARQKQRDQEDKLHAKKAGNMDIKKGSNHELKLPQMKKPGAYHLKLDNKLSAAAISSIDIQQASTCSTDGSYYADLCDNKQENCTPVRFKASCYVRDSTQEKSYEISPYLGSDNEDDEDELPTKKFIPSWASNLLAESLSLMREVDPSVIFPPESCCSINEVLLP